ncbi:hypothetical protein IW261DRAFT_20339 [Armillaria novae-zelandiae]|uniref:Uncharacterized protein n=1 Tax=Armillaria novae-zelandiae TaxID=153914 RepID=A0AA39PVL6_9AGAR|nr:hypothetical protein IW261DRAFT_20339 [Armillaria novae-zelandiae]
MADLNNHHRRLSSTPSLARPKISSGIRQTVRSFSSGSLSILPRENLLILHPRTNHAALKLPSRRFVSGTLSFQHPSVGQTSFVSEPKPLRGSQPVSPLESGGNGIEPDDDVVIVSESHLPPVKAHAEITEGTATHPIYVEPQSASNRLVRETLKLPVREQYDKARRLLRHPQFPIYLAVSMYGSVEEFEITPNLKYGISFHAAESLYLLVL